MTAEQLQFWDLPSSFCRICSRPLSNPDSVKNGIGPICNGKHHREETMEQNEYNNRYYLPLPLEEHGVVLERNEETGEPETNVPWRVIEHSPAGLEWGYGGSGPADLALNILEAVLLTMNYDGARIDCFKNTTCFGLAWKLHQDFKWNFISKMPPEGGRIPYEDIVIFILNHTDTLSKET